MSDSVSQEAQALIAAHRSRTDAHVYARTHAYRRYARCRYARGHYMNVWVKNDAWEKGIMYSKYNEQYGCRQWQKWLPVNARVIRKTELWGFLIMCKERKYRMKVSGGRVKDGLPFWFCTNITCIRNCIDFNYKLKEFSGYTKVMNIDNSELMSA